jgi:tetratricopeptide (TPR) repeat protein
MLVMGLMHRRYFVFASTVGIIMAADELNRFWLSIGERHDGLWKHRVEKAFTLTLVVCIALFSLFQSGDALLRIRRQLLFQNIYEPGKEVADFIVSNKVPGRMFNSDYIGGYLIWRLYPWKQVFIDTRQIDIASSAEFKAVMNAVPAEEKGKRALWERLLSTYEVNFLIFNVIDYQGNLAGLVLDLADNDRWVPVFAEKNNFIYVKVDPQNEYLIERFRLSREDILWSVIAYASTVAQSRPQNSNLLYGIGKCFVKLGKYDEAEKAFRHVLQLVPGRKDAEEALEKVSELRNAEGTGSHR